MTAEHEALAGLPEPFPPLYDPLPQPQLMTVDGQSLLRVGSSGWVAICVDPTTGEIMSVASLVPPGGEERWQRPRPMNRDMSALNACLRAARLALTEGSNDDPDHVAQLLRTRLQALDPRAMADRDGFWNSLCDDVALGDWATV